MLRRGERTRIGLAGGSEADYLAKRAEKYIGAAADRAHPFWLHLNPSSPHGPHHPADRWKGSARDEPLYSSEGRREQDLSDKPDWIEGDAAPENSALLKTWRGKIEESRAVDDLVGRVVDVLWNTGQLRDTIIVFLSDNGYHFGEHHQNGKLTPYDEATRSPLVLCGPGFPAGVRTWGLTSTLDVAPTLLRAAGASTTGMDGRLLDPLTGNHRDYLFVENFMFQRWIAARSASHLYVRHDAPEAMEELYDLAADPALNESVTASADPLVLEGMRARVTAFEACAGDACRVAEEGEGG